MYLSALFMIERSDTLWKRVVLELRTFYFCHLAWWLLTATDAMEPLHSESFDVPVHQYVCCSLCSRGQLHGRWAFPNRGVVTCPVQHGIAQNCARSNERDLLFHLIIKSICPFQIHCKVGLLWTELQRSPCWWHCIDYCSLILHVFLQSFLLFLI